MGETEQAGAAVYLVAYRPAWPEDFRREADRLRAGLGEALVDIHHIGSTAVPGLIAKPLIDMLLVVRALEPVAGYDAPLRRLGYVPLAQNLGGPKYVDPPGGDQALPRAHQLHIEPVGSEHARRSLLFRDYLRAHPARAAQYAALKEQLARQFPADRLAFTRGKGAFINEVLREAADWSDREPFAGY